MFLRPIACLALVLALPVAGAVEVSHASPFLEVFVDLAGEQGAIVVSVGAPASAAPVSDAPPHREDAPPSTPLLPLLGPPLAALELSEELLPLLSLEEAIGSLPIILPEDEADAPVEAWTSRGPVGVAAAATTPSQAPASMAAAELAAVGVAIAATAAAPALPTLLGRLRRLLPVGALLYTRIARERLLDHATRERLLERIGARAGVAVADLTAETGISRNTVVYHLRRLEREGLVVSERSGRTRLFFAAGTRAMREQTPAFAALRHDTSRAVARAVGQAPGMDQRTVCAEVGVTPSLAHWHTTRLVEAGVLESRKDGRHVRYYPGEAYHLVDAPPTGGPVGPSRA